MTWKPGGRDELKWFAADVYATGETVLFDIKDALYVALTFYQERMVIYEAVMKDVESRRRIQ